MSPDELGEFLESLQDAFWRQEDGGFNDVVCGFDDDAFPDYAAELCGCPDSRVWRLNFAGAGDWFYFLLVPDEQADLFAHRAEEFPVYFVDLSSNDVRIQLEAPNMKEFIYHMFPDKEYWTPLSVGKVSQRAPQVRATE